MTIRGFVYTMLLAGGTVLGCGPRVAVEDPSLKEKSSGCKTKKKKSSSLKLAGDSGYIYGFQDDIKPKLEVHCKKCHNPEDGLQDPIFDSFESLSANNYEKAKKVVGAIDRGSMPIGGLSKITPSERDAFRAWIKQGFPADGAGYGALYKPPAAEEDAPADSTVQTIVVGGEEPAAGAAAADEGPSGPSPEQIKLQAELDEIKKSMKDGKASDEEKKKVERLEKQLEAERAKQKDKDDDDDDDGGKSSKKDDC